MSAYIHATCYGSVGIALHALMGFRDEFESADLVVDGLADRAVASTAALAAYLAGAGNRLETRQRGIEVEVDVPHAQSLVERFVGDMGQGIPIDSGERRASLDELACREK